MTTKMPIIYESEITAQASAAITADTDSGGSLTMITNTTAGNGGGCHLYQCFVNVTAAPSGDAVCRLYYASSPSGTPDQYDSGSLSVSIPSGETGTFDLGCIISPAKYSYCKIAAEDYGFTASLIVVPVLPEAQ